MMFGVVHKNVATSIGDHSVRVLIPIPADSKNLSRFRLRVRFFQNNTKFRARFRIRVRIPCLPTILPDPRKCLAEVAYAKTMRKTLGLAQNR